MFTLVLTVCKWLAGVQTELFKPLPGWQILILLYLFILHSVNCCYNSEHVIYICIIYICLATIHRFPSNVEALHVEEQFLWGSSLLITPVMREVSWLYKLPSWKALRNIAWAFLNQRIIRVCFILKLVNCKTKINSPKTEAVTQIFHEFPSLALPC